jgi:tetratricopeptide (TPR) repeat protein
MLKNKKADKGQEKERPVRHSSWFADLVNIDPVQVVSDLWDAFDMWRATRRWRPFLMAIPLLLLLMLLTGPVVYGWIFAGDSTRKAYEKKALEIDPLQDVLSGKRDSSAKDKSQPAMNEDGSLLAEGEEEDIPVELSEEEKKKKAEEELRDMQFADMLYRRILQLNASNKYATFQVAAMHGMRGNLEKARSMMDQLAPEDGQGFASAHAWLAWDLHNQMMAGEKVEFNIFEHHMLSASDFQGSEPWAQVLVFYARKLESDGKISEAINMLQRAAAIDKKLMLALSQFYAKHNQPLQSREMADQAAQHFSESLGKRDELDINRILVAQARVQALRFDEAIQVLQEGLRIRPDRPQLKRALSNVYRLMFRSEIEQSSKEGKFKANLGLLNAAILADPTNPSVGEEIMILKNLGVTVDEKMIQLLREQLAGGGASAVTHLLLGNAYFNQKERNLEKAIAHWQLAMGQDPNMVLALNNLGVAMSYLDPPKIEEGLKLVERAIDLSGGNPEYLDSKGEILDRAGRHEEAIAAYEKALQRDQLRLGTREKLVKSYQSAGLQDMADAQLTVLGKIRDFQKSRGIDVSTPVAAVEEPAKPQPKKDAQPKAKINLDDLDFKGK